MFMFCGMSALESSGDVDHNDVMSVDSKYSGDKSVCQAQFFVVGGGDCRSQSCLQGAMTSATQDLT